MCDGFVEEGGWTKGYFPVLLFSMRKKMNPFLWLLAPMEDASVCRIASGVCGLSIESGGI